MLQFKEKVENCDEAGLIKRGSNGHQREYDSDWQGIWKL